MALEEAPQHVTPEKEAEPLFLGFLKRLVTDHYIERSGERMGFVGHIKDIDTLLEAYDKIWIHFKADKNARIVIHPHDKRARLVNFIDTGKTDGVKILEILLVHEAHHPDELEIGEQEKTAREEEQS
jgi:hypothetical protein